jgi:hypothetical protein
VAFAAEKPAKIRTCVRLRKRRGSWSLSEKPLVPSESARELGPHAAFESSIFVKHVLPNERLPECFYRLEDLVAFAASIHRDADHVSPRARDEKLSDHSGCSQLPHERGATDARPGKDEHRFF